MNDEKPPDELRTVVAAFILIFSLIGISSLFVGEQGGGRQRLARAQDRAVAQPTVEPVPDSLGLVDCGHISLEWEKLSAEEREICRDNLRKLQRREQLAEAAVPDDRAARAAYYRALTNQTEALIKAGQSMEPLRHGARMGRCGSEMRRYLPRAESLRAEVPNNGDEEAERLAVANTYLHNCVTCLDSAMQACTNAAAALKGGYRQRDMDNGN